MYFLLTFLVAFIQSQSKKRAFHNSKEINLKLKNYILTSMSKEKETKS